MARRGELPAIKVARHWRFRAAAIESWLRELETGVPDELRRHPQTPPGRSR